MKDERTEKAMKRIHSKMRDTNNQIFDIIKRQRTSAITERTYMSIPVMYLTLKVMAKDDPARKQMSQRMVETTLEANEMNVGEGDSAETEREHRNEREVGIDTRFTHNVWTDEGDVDEIKKHDERGVQNDEIKMSSSTKEKDEREVRNRTDDESRIIRAANKDDDRGDGETMENGNDDVVANRESLSKASSSRHVAKTYNRTCSDDKAA